eukprot:GILI01005721.1.p1 GENE.GILI01005721.1~~GILI01005721.1.p1  ORF type:complete len:505 (+),score=131.75 GILI01005721.1:65-1579(+)
MGTSIHLASDSAHVRAWRWIVIAAMTFGYAGYYLCKSNFTVVSTVWKTNKIHSQEEIGDVIMAGTFMYALGKIVSGPTIDYFGPKPMFIFGMFGCALGTLPYAFYGESNTVLYFSWALCRFISAVGWACVVAMTPRWIPPSHQGKIFGLLSLSYLFGDALVRAVLGLLLNAGMTWQSVLIFTATGLGLIGILEIFILKASPVDVGGEEAPSEEGQSRPRGRSRSLSESLGLVGANGETDDSTGKSKSSGNFAYLVGPLLRDPRFYCICLMSASITIIREIFRDWTSIFIVATTGASDGDASIGSLVFPFSGGIATIFAGIINDKISKKHRPLFLITLVAFLIASLGVLWYCVHETSDGDRLSLGLIVSIVFIVGFFMTGPFSFIGGVFPVEIGGKERSATANTLFEAVGYLASVTSGTIGKLADKYGWSIVFMFMLGLGVLALISLVGYWITSVAHNKKVASALRDPLLSNPVKHHDVSSYTETTYAQRDNSINHTADKYQKMV